MWPLLPQCEADLLFVDSCYLCRYLLVSARPCWLLSRLASAASSASGDSAASEQSASTSWDASTAAARDAAASSTTAGHAATTAAFGVYAGAFV